jgi:Zn-dependent alcohol dehydrogenases, class III
MGAVLAGAGPHRGHRPADDKLGLARQLGATDTVNAKDADHVKQVRDLTNGGVDYAFDLAGTIKAMETAYLVTRWGGTTVTAGLRRSPPISPSSRAVLVSEEKTIKGSYMGSCVPVRDIPRFIALYQQGKLPVDRMVSQRIGFDQLNEGFDRCRTWRRYGRCWCLTDDRQPGPCHLDGRGSPSSFIFPACSP